MGRASRTRRLRRAAARAAALAAWAPLALLAGCGEAAAVPEADSEAEARAERSRALSEHRPVHVDSVRPIQVEIERFHATLEERPTSLRGGATSREALVERFVRALAERDSTALGEMLLSRAEFGYLYYPYTKFTARPYELSPFLLWFQMEIRTGRGIVRALRAHGGRTLPLIGQRCDPEPESEGENRLWRGCVLLLEPTPGDTAEVTLFGSIIERDGRYKFVSYSNSL